jgi:predicted alpha/beta hydrolase family esterase
MRQVVVIGGGETFDTREEYLTFLKGMTPSLTPKEGKGWKGNLQEDLGKKYQVFKLSMPNALNAKYEEWKIYFDNVTPHLKNGCILVGHSLGGLFLLKYLDEEGIHFLPKATIFVATPFSGQGIQEEGFADFVTKNNGRTMHNNYGKVHIIYSTDDEIVPIRNATILHHLFPQSFTHELEGRGHLYKDEHFPELVKIIKSLK